MKKLNPSLIGFLQALGVIGYCALIGGVLRCFGKVFAGPLGFLGTVLMLVLLVFSAAITGLIFFGCPVYLVLNKKTKQALTILGFTLLYCLVIILIIIIVTMALI